MKKHAFHLRRNDVIMDLNHISKSNASSKRRKTRLIMLIFFTYN